MKNRYVAAFLALFFGAFGIHRFYLGQKGLGIAYIALFFFLYRVTILVGIVDAVILFAMDQDEFDHKYNKKSYASIYGSGEKSDQLAERKRYFEAKKAAEEFKKSQKNPGKKPKNQMRNIRKLKKAGKKAFEKYDLERAIEQYEQAVKIDQRDAESHFRLACAYSLMEQTERAFFHLDRAVRLGWKDKKRIENEEALAYIRVQPLWEVFVNNGYYLPSEPDAQRSRPQKKIDPERETLLDQLKQLTDRRDRGEITKEEFRERKEKLFER